MNKNQIIEKLNASICLGSIIIVFDLDNLDFLQLLSARMVSQNITNMEIWQAIEEKSSSQISIYVSKEVVDNTIKINRMYDFSDKVLVLSNSEQYGSLYDYVKTGILTMEEMADALLYQSETS